VTAEAVAEEEAAEDEDYDYRAESEQAEPVSSESRTHFVQVDFAG
jgi:hypothetical protein